MLPFRRKGLQLLPSLKGLLESTQACAKQTISNFIYAPNGPAVKQIAIEDEWYNRQRMILPLLDSMPYTSMEMYVAPNAVVVGDVDIYGNAAIFSGAVIRGDLNKIRISCNTVILDRAVIHAAKAVPTGLNAATYLGEHVLVEPHAVLRSCRVDPVSIIGARSVVCEGAIIEGHSILAPGSVVPPARRIPSGQLWGGNPAKFIRKLTALEVDRVVTDTVAFYTALAQQLKRETMQSTAWRDVEAWRAKQVANGEYEWVNYREQKYMTRLQHEAEEMARLVQ